MAKKTSNIIVGAANVFLTAGAAAVSTKPAFVAGEDYSATLEGHADWRDTGYTTDGLELSYEPDYAEIEVDQLLDVAKIFKQSIRASLNTTMVEATLENLQIAWAQVGELKSAGDTPFDGGTALADEEVEIGMEAGALGDAPDERQLIAVGRSPVNADKAAGAISYQRVYHVRRVLSMETSSHSMRRSEATSFPVSFRLLADATQTGAEYGTIRDRKITA